MRVGRQRSGPMRPRKTKAKSAPPVASTTSRPMTSAASQHRHRARRGGDDEGDQHHELVGGGIEELAELAALIEHARGEARRGSR